MNAFMECPEETLKRLGVNQNNGLTSSQVTKSRKMKGENVFSKKRPVSLGRRIWEAASEPMLIMLLIAAFITLGVNITRYMTGGRGDFLECAGIFVAIFLSVMITVIMEGKSAKAFEVLSKIGEDTSVKVIRDGAVQLILQKEVVVGDILYNSLSVPIAERKNTLYSGCFIVEGNGTMVVTAVGDHTEFGKIAKELSDTANSSTPLQEKMAILGKRITVLGAVAAAIVFLIQLILLFKNGSASFDIISEAFITSIVLIVAAVPEGLPTIVAVSLAVNIIKMSQQNALVKKMIACETVGCINVICSDKTGTLTQNRMTVTDIYHHGNLYKPEDAADPTLLENICINSTADIHCCDDKVKFIGNPTECALLAAVRKTGNDYHNIRTSAQMIHVYPFRSETKNMTTILKKEGRFVAFTKGSPEKIISMCQISISEQRKIEKQMIYFQKKACRVIGFAHKELSGVIDFHTDREQMERNMIFDGFAAITDPLREDVYESVCRCKQAGIELKMLTGDNLITATAIADELHMLDHGHIAVEAEILDAMTEEELVRELPKIHVIARSTPIIKMRVVNALKASGNVVAVTGDGINDAPAIKNADVGVAMGISGTEVSKEASDIVLLDDSFSTIVKAVQWGRGIYENFQRFIQFQLTVNLSSVIVVLASILSGFAAPFTALELLWINIIMDGPPALTLGLEPIRGNLMDRNPTPRYASIVSSNMLLRIVTNGVYISIVFMAQHWTNFLGGTKEELPTILFTLFVVFQLFNALNSRELNSISIFKNIGSNRLMLGVFALTFGLQVMITQFGSAFFSTVPLSFSMWMRIIGVGATVILMSEAVKWLQRCFRIKPRKKGNHKVDKKLKIK